MLIELIGYLISSANILFNEPYTFGSVRLLEGAKRIIDYMEKKGFADPDLTILKRKIENSEPLVLKDEESFKEAIIQLVKDFGRIYKKIS